MIKKLARLIIATLYICSLLALPLVIPQQPVLAAGTLTVADVAVFSSVVQEDDWVVCVYYENEWNPPYPTGIATNYFDLVFDTTGIDAKIAQPDWGYRPAWIYISPTTAATLTWDSTYDFTMIGKLSQYAAPPPSDTLALIAGGIGVGDWLGSDMEQLDKWVRDTAIAMGVVYTKVYYTETYGGTTFAAGEGILTPLGAELFLRGMPGLDSVRPGLFATGGSGTQYTPKTFNKAYENTQDWEATIGTDISDIANDTGTLVNLSGRMIAAFITFLIYCGLAAAAFKAIPEPQTGVILALPVPFFGFWAGFIDLAIAGVIGALLILFTVYLIWIRGS